MVSRRLAVLGLTLSTIVLLSPLVTSGQEPSPPIQPLADSAFIPVGPTPPLLHDTLEPSILPKVSALPTPVVPRPTKPPIPKVTPKVIVVVKATPKPAPKPKVVTSSRSWNRDGNVSWYGPGFYGHRTACGLAYTKTLKGVAHRTLPCGTLVTFRNPANGRVATVPVIDRGPYVSGRQWDLSGGLCVFLDHCYTGPIQWRLSK